MPPHELVCQRELRVHGFRNRAWYGSYHHFFELVDMRERVYMNIGAWNRCPTYADPGRPRVGPEDRRYRNSVGIGEHLPRRPEVEKLHARRLDTNFHVGHRPP